MGVARLSVFQFVRPLPSCIRARTAAPSTAIRVADENFQPTPNEQSPPPCYREGIFLFASIVFLCDRIPKPERHANYFPGRQDAARLWLECGDRDGLPKGATTGAALGAGTVLKEFPASGSRNRR